MHEIYVTKRGAIYIYVWLIATAQLLIPIAVAKWEPTFR
jgi:hypothetical protein